MFGKSLPAPGLSKPSRVSLSPVSAATTDQPRSSFLGSHSLSSQPDRGPLHCRLRELPRPHGDSAYGNCDYRRRLRRLRDERPLLTYLVCQGGFSGDGGPARNATLNYAESAALDLDGNLYIADTINHRIRRVDASTGLIHTIAGNGVSGFSGDGGPGVDRGNQLPGEHRGGSIRTSLFRRREQQSHSSADSGDTTATSLRATPAPLSTHLRSASLSGAWCRRFPCRQQLCFFRGRGSGQLRPFAFALSPIPAQRVHNGLPVRTETRPAFTARVFFQVWKPLVSPKYGVQIGNTSSPCLATQSPGTPVSAFSVLVDFRQASNRSPHLNRFSGPVALNTPVVPRSTSVMSHAARSRTSINCTGFGRRAGCQHFSAAVDPDRPVSEAPAGIVGPNDVSRPHHCRAAR